MFHCCINFSVNEDHIICDKFTEDNHAEKDMTTLEPTGIYVYIVFVLPNELDKMCGKV
jgi:hypothetical protein